jgi:hypothetical protein
MESAPRGGELVPKTRVTFGSEVRFLRSPQIRRGDEVRVGSAHRPATPASVRAPRVRLSPSPPSGPARVSGGEPSPGLARSLVEVAKTVRPPTATRCTRGFDSRPRLSRSCAQGVQGRTPACQFGGAGSIPTGRSRTHAWPIGARHRPSKPARRVRFPPRAQSVFAGRVGTRAGLISRTRRFDSDPCNGKRPRGAALVNMPLQGPTFRRAPNSKPDAVGMGRGQQPLEQHPSKTRWQTAGRTSASRRSSGEMTAERCLSSVDGDAPGPYPGEDRSSRSRGSDTRVAKRQRRRLLSAPPQVRILPLVLVPIG